MSLEVLYEDNHLIAVIKPVNMPMQEDSSHDPDLLNAVKDYIKEKYQKPGNVYLGLLHRLDRPVGGVCIFAKTSKAASRMSESIRTHEFKKTYLAIVEDNGLKEKDEFRDYLLKDKKTNMVTVSKEGKLAILDYELIKRVNNYCLVKVNLKTGRPHQIRVQFASRKHYLYGDMRYNPHAKKGEQIMLWSYQISFKHPVSKEEIIINASPKGGMWNEYC